MSSKRSNAIKTCQAGDRAEPPAGDHEDLAPERDAKGRFVGSGNPAGRPRRVREPEPTTLAAAGARALRQRVPVKINGESRTVPALEAISMRLVNQALAGSSIELFRALRTLMFLKVFDAADDLAKFQAELAENKSSGMAWTDELEAAYQVVEGQYEDEEDLGSLDRVDEPTTLPRDE